MQWRTVMLRVLPWLLAGGFAALAGFFAFQSSSDAAPVPGAGSAAGSVVGPESPTVAPSPTATAFGPLRQCQTRLEVAQSRLALAGGPAAAELSADAIVAAEEKAAAREARREVVLDSVEEFLGATDEEARWVMEFVCAVRGLRGDVIADLREGKLTLDQAATRQKAEREDTLTDLQAFLGDDRYAKLRKVGGLGKLGDLFECD